MRRALGSTKLGVNVRRVYLAPQNILSAIVLTLGSNVVLIAAVGQYHQESAEGDPRLQSAASEHFGGLRDHCLL